MKVYMVGIEKDGDMITLESRLVTTDDGEKEFLCSLDKSSGILYGMHGKALDYIGHGLKVAHVYTREVSEGEPFTLHDPSLLQNKVAEGLVLLTGQVIVYFHGDIQHAAIFDSVADVEHNYPELLLVRV